MLRIAEIHRHDICFTGEGGRVRKYALAGQLQRPQESTHVEVGPIAIVLDSA